MWCILSCSAVLGDSIWRYLKSFIYISYSDYIYIYIFSACLIFSPSYNLICQKKMTSAHGLHSRFEGLGNNCFTHCLPHRGIHVHICLLARDPVKRRADSHLFWPLGLPGESEDWGSIWSLQFPASRTGCKVVSRCWFFAALCTVNMFQLYSHLGRCHVWKRFQNARSSANTKHQNDMPDVSRQPWHSRSSHKPSVSGVGVPAFLCRCLASPSDEKAQISLCALWPEEASCFQNVWKP